MNSDRYKKIIKHFSILIGYIRIAMEYDSFNDVRSQYEGILNRIVNWSRNYSLNRSFENITYEESLSVHTLIDDIREKKLFDKNIGEEKNISDEILIWYEALMKDINGEKGGINGKR